MNSKIKKSVLKKIIAFARNRLTDTNSNYPCEAMVKIFTINVRAMIKNIRAFERNIKVVDRFIKPMAEKAWLAGCATSQVVYPQQNGKYSPLGNSIYLRIKWGF